MDIKWVIRMIRNKEVGIYSLTIGIFGLAATLCAAFFSGMVAAMIVLLISSVLIIANLTFTFWRYREMNKLAVYLRQIASGDYQLDVRDNDEGELSILKSEIYKVTKILSEHTSILNEEKQSLTDAISDISHQLKTPLTSMMMMADFLSDANLPADKRQEFTGKIQLQLERFEWLVSSLLKLSKIDAGTAQFKKEKIIVKNLIHKAIEPVLIPIDVKEQSIQILGDDNVSFIGDLNWTSEALLNILKNCVEHTQIGGRISITFSENPLLTEIKISDNGKGIEKEDLPYIFKRFYKGKHANDESVGIGLAMASSIITSQKGDIEVKSSKGVGTEFTIKFYKQVI